MYLKIANQVIEVVGELQYVRDFFYDFRISDENIKEDIRWEIVLGELEVPTSARVLFKNGYYEIFEEENFYYTIYPGYSYCFATITNLTNGNAKIFVSDNTNGKALEDLQCNFSFVLRDIFWARLRQINMVAIHSSTIIYNDKAYMFSGLSGTGKTTHTNMWCDSYNVDILDGDMCICSVEAGKVYAYGSPWCGSSGKYLNKKVELGGIIFLHQAKSNYIEEMEYTNRVINLYCRNFITPMKEKNLSKIIEIAKIIAEECMCVELYNLPQIEAVQLIKNRIDNHVA